MRSCVTGGRVIRAQVNDPGHRGPQCIPAEWTGGWMNGQMQELTVGGARQGQCLWRGGSVPGSVCMCVSVCMARWGRSIPSLSRVRLFATPRTAARQASLSMTNSWSLLTLTSIESVMPSSHLILCRPLLLLPSIFPSIRVFSIESVLRIR